MDSLWNTFDFFPGSYRVWTLAPLDVDLVILSKDAPVSLRHLFSCLVQVGLRLHVVARESVHPPLVTFAVLLFLRFLVDTAHVASAEEELGVLALGVERIDIDAGVFASIPVLLKDLSKFVSALPTLDFQLVFLGGYP